MNDSPKPPAGPGDLSEETPAHPPPRKDDPKPKPPAGPGKFPEPADDANIGKPVGLGDPIERVKGKGKRG